MFHIHLIILVGLYLSRSQNLRPAWELLEGCSFEFPRVSFVILAAMLALLAIAALIAVVDAFICWVIND